MPGVLVSFSAKCTATQSLVIPKSNGRKDFIFTARNYLFKFSNLSTRIRCESCSILRTSMLTIFNIKNVDVNDIQY